MTYSKPKKSVESERFAYVADLDSCIIQPNLSFGQGVVSRFSLRVVELLKGI